MMIKEIKEKLKKAWEWIKEKVKKFKKWIIALLIPIVLAAPLLIPPNRSFENLPNVIKEEALYRIKYDKWSEVEIPEIAMPEAVLKKWGDETWIKISYPDFHPVNPKQHQGKLKWENTDKEVHLYPLEPREYEENGQIVRQLEQGGFEFQIIENKKTQSQLILDLELGNVKAYYQPPLNEEEKDNPNIDYCTETACYKNGKIVIFRPKNVVGSYVFYHATKGNVHPVGEADKYKTSQIGILYRPKIIDAVGNWVWGKQEIKDGKLIITRPQEFLDTAIYPIRHAGGETFGYETAGGSSSYATNEMDGSWFTCPESGTATKLTVYDGYGSDTSNAWAKLALYKRSDVTFVAGTIQRTQYSSGWQDFLFSENPSLLNIDYWLLHWQYGQSQENKYNSGDAGKGHRTTSYSYNGWPSPVTITAQSRIYSIYCTYTPGAAERRVIIIE